MITQVIFKIDKTLKDRAMKKAAKQGVPFAVVLKFATQAFVDNKLNIGLVGDEVFNPTVRNEITHALKDIVKGKNLSPKFSSVKEIRSYLNH